jgi:Holliday junction resolvase RusA-like endonuclease
MAFLYSPAPPKQHEPSVPLLVAFTYPGQPVPAMRARVTSRGTFNPEKYTRYRRGLAIAIRSEFQHLIPDAPVPGSKARAAFLRAHRYRLIADFYLEDHRPVDSDNLAKCLMDALQDSGIIQNDSQIDETTIRKHHGHESPRVVFTLEELQRE